MQRGNSDAQRKFSQVVISDDSPTPLYGDSEFTPTPIFGDNKAAIRTVEEDLISSGNQYIYLSYHAIKEGVELGSIKPYYKKSNLNLADLFTKNVVAGTVKSLLDVLCGYKLVLFEPDKDKSNRWLLELQVTLD